MEWKYNYRHTFESRVLPCKRLVAIGEGGAGRTAVRAFERHVESLSRPCPLLGVAEWDLACDTGRTDTEPPYEPAFVENLVTRIMPGLNPGAVVREHGDDLHCGLWEAVDRDAVGSLDVSSQDIGGYASPAVTRLAQLVYPDRIEEFAIAVAQLADSLGTNSGGGWQCSDPGLVVMSFASPCGAVGSTALHLLDALKQRLTPPFWILHFSLLIAERGRVVSRAEARALQFAFLKEFDIRCQN